MGAETNGAFREARNKIKNNVLLNVTRLLKSAGSHLISNVRNLCRSPREAKRYLWKVRKWWEMFPSSTNILNHVDDQA